MPETVGLFDNSAYEWPWKPILYQYLFLPGWLLNSPDQSTRIAAFDGMVNSGDAALRDIAIDERSDFEQGQRQQKQTD